MGIKFLTKGLLNKSLLKKRRKMNFFRFNQGNLFPQSMKDNWNKSNQKRMLKKKNVQKNLQHCGKCLSGKEWNWWRVFWVFAMKIISVATLFGMDSGGLTFYNTLKEGMLKLTSFHFFPWFWLAPIIKAQLGKLYGGVKYSINNVQLEINLWKWNALWLLGFPPSQMIIFTPWLMYVWLSGITTMLTNISRRAENLSLIAMLQG